MSATCLGNRQRPTISVAVVGEAHDRTLDAVYGAAKLDEVELVRYLRAGELLPREAALALREMVQRAYRAGAPRSQTRREVAERLGVSRDVLDDRLSIASKLESDDEVAGRLASMVPVFKTRRSGPRSSGLAIYRLLLRVEPRELLLEILDELKKHDELTYRKVIELVHQVRSRAGGGPPRFENNDPVSFPVAAPSVAAKFHELGIQLVEPIGVGLPLSEWRRLLSKDGRARG